MPNYNDTLYLGQYLILIALSAEQRNVGVTALTIGYEWRCPIADGRELPLWVGSCRSDTACLVVSNLLQRMIHRSEIWRHRFGNSYLAFISKLLFLGLLFPLRPLR
jgi:hypothetical protein